MIKYIVFFLVLAFLSPFIFIAGGIEAILNARRGELPFLLRVDEEEEDW